jgi:small-conductance mechanosensitive channel
MQQLWRLVVETDSVGERLVTSLVVVLVAGVIGEIVGRLVAHRLDDAYGRYYARKAARYVTALVALIVLAVVWRAFAGRFGVVLGLTAAGLAFAMQEVIGAIAGWFNIVSGRIFRVGDRIQMGGVKGDVLDITPLRTKIMEMGTPEGDSWVHGRQFTGRIVAVSNKATFTEPVFNYSTMFEFIWEELAFGVPVDSDWKRGEQILLDEARRASASEPGADAMSSVARNYPIAHADVEPRVFVRVTDDWIELAARFVVHVRTARRVKDEMTRRVLDRFDAAGLRVAARTLDVSMTTDDGG